jgi:hypothetical protein
MENVSKESHAWNSINLNMDIRQDFLGNSLRLGLVFMAGKLLVVFKIC